MEAVQTTQPQQSWVLFMSVTNSVGKRDKIHTMSGWWLLLSCSVVLDSLQARRASLSFTISWSSLKRVSIEVVTPSNPLILCRPFSSHLQSFPASGSFPMSQFFTSDGQSTGASASASVLPMNIQGRFPLSLTGRASSVKITVFTVTHLTCPGRS